MIGRLLLSCLLFLSLAGVSNAQPVSQTWLKPGHYLPQEVISWEATLAPASVNIVTQPRNLADKRLRDFAYPNPYIDPGAENARWFRRVIAELPGRGNVVDMRDAVMLPAPGRVEATLPLFDKSRIEFSYCAANGVVDGGSARDLNLSFWFETENGQKVGQVTALPLKVDGCRAWTPAVMPLPPARGVKAVVSLSTAESKPAYVAVFLGSFRMVTRLESEQDVTAALEKTLGRPVGPNLVLFLVDAARSDVVGPGNSVGPSVTPNIDRRGKNGVFFTNSFSISNQTRPSITGLLQGQHPTVGKYFTRATAVPKKVLKAYHDNFPPMLPLLLKMAGYTTVSIGRNHFQYENTILGLDPGFSEIWDYRDSTNDTHFIINRAIEWITQNKDRKFFLLVNIPAPHQPYAAPKEYLDVVNKDYASIKKPKVYKTYLGEIRYSDAEFERFASAVDSLGLASETIIALTADHGESMDPGHVCRRRTENGSPADCKPGHGYSLIDDEVHVPLVFLFPAWTGLKAQVRTNAVSAIDVAPTFLRLAGLQLHPRHSGRDLIADLQGISAPDETIYLEAGCGAALRAGKYKLVLRHPKEEPPAKAPASTSGKPAAAQPGVELYDLSADPRELKNVAHGQQARCDSLRSTLRGLRIGFTQKDVEGQKTRWLPAPGMNPPQTPWTRF